MSEYYAGMGCKCAAWEEDWNARADGWISVDDRLPDDNVDILIWSNDVAVVGRYWSLVAKFLCSDARVAQGMDVTHWQPLPPPPETLK